MVAAVILNLLHSLYVHQLDVCVHINYLIACPPPPGSKPTPEVAMQACTVEFVHVHGILLVYLAGGAPGMACSCQDAE
eukprot:1157841-Pelagomonas_calceolata.AAC.4